MILAVVSVVVTIVRLVVILECCKQPREDFAYEVWNDCHTESATIDNTNVIVQSPRFKQHTLKFRDKVEQVAWIAQLLRCDTLSTTHLITCGESSVWPYKRQYIDNFYPRVNLKPVKAPFCVIDATQIKSSEMWQELVQKQSITRKDGAYFVEGEKILKLLTNPTKIHCLTADNIYTWSMHSIK